MLVVLALLAVPAFAETCGWDVSPARLELYDAAIIESARVPLTTIERVTGFDIAPALNTLATARN